MKKIIFITILFSSVLFPQGNLLDLFSDDEIRLTYLTNQLFWFDGTKELTNASWGDQSVNNRDLTLVGEPVVTVSGLNGKPIVTFNGTDERSNTILFTQNQPVTVYIVFKSITYTSSDDFFDGGAANKMVFRQNGTTPALGIYAGTALASGKNPAIGDWAIFSLVFNTTSSIIQMNDSTETTGTAGVATGLAGFTLGCRAGYAAGFANFSVAEIIGYSGAHNEATRDLIKTYLNAKYGIY